MISIKVNLFKILSGICFIGALGCLAYEPVKTELVSSYRPTVTRSAVERNQHARANYNMSQVKPVSMKRVINARTHASHVKVLGQLLVPDSNVHLPIGKGISSSTLMLAAGTMRPNMQMGRGNYALAGHHMINKSALFTPLYYHLKIGGNVYLTDMKNLYQYRVTTRKMISPTSVQVVNNTSQPLITLITCNDSGSRRMMIRGKFIKKTPLKSAPATVAKLMKKKANNYNVLEGY